MVLTMSTQAIYKESVSELIGVHIDNGVHIWREANGQIVKKAVNHPDNKHAYPYNCILPEHDMTDGGLMLLAHVCNCQKCKWIQAGSPGKNDKPEDVWMKINGMGVCEEIKNA